MENVYDPSRPEAVEIANYPQGGDLIYTREVSLVGEDDVQESCALLYEPTGHELLNLIRGGTIRVLLAGVKTPPSIDVAVTDLTRHPPISDLDAAAKLMYTGPHVQGGARTISWEDLPPETQELFRLRVRLVWDLFCAAHLPSPMKKNVPSDS